MINYTVNYTKIDSGYLGQLVEWPEVATERYTVLTQWIDCCTIGTK